MLAWFGFLIVNSLLAAPCNVSFVLTSETVSVRLVVGCVFILTPWTPSCPFPLHVVKASKSIASPSADTFHPLLVLTSDLIASMIFVYVLRVQSFGAKCCATVALSTPAMTVAASISTGTGFPLWSS